MFFFKFYCTFYPPGSFTVDFGIQVLESLFKVDMNLIGMLGLSVCLRATRISLDSTTFRPPGQLLT